MDAMIDSLTIRLPKPAYLAVLTVLLVKRLIAVIHAEVLTSDS